MTARDPDLGPELVTKVRRSLYLRPSRLLRLRGDEFVRRTKTGLKSEKENLERVRGHLCLREVLDVPFPLSTYYL